MISHQILQGDSYHVLHSLGENSEQRGKYRLIVTSPPYFRYRHYGQDMHEIGQEETAEIFIEKLVKIFTICRDLLTDDGSLWIVNVNLNVMLHAKG
jgi:tRNA1(Val) A37 N6-methylase TrmN6